MKIEFSALKSGAQVKADNHGVSGASFQTQHVQQVHLLSSGRVLIVLQM